MIYITTYATDDNGLWSSTCWPADTKPTFIAGDIVNINHNVTMDDATLAVDLGLVTIAANKTLTMANTAMAGSFGGLVVTGTLACSTTVRSYLSLKGNLSGAGALTYGTSGAGAVPALVDGTPVTATIAFTGAYKCTMSAVGGVAMYGEVRTLYDTLSIGQAAIDSTITLTTGLTLRAGDVIVITNSNSGQQGANATIHTVLSYLNKVVTLTAAIGRIVNASDGVGILSCSILLTNTGKTASTSFTSSVLGGILSGVKLYNFARGPIESETSWSVTSCVGYGNTNGAIAYRGYGHNLTSCNAYSGDSGFVYMGFNHSLTSCMAYNMTSGGLAGYAYSHIFISCIAYNCTFGGIAMYAFGISAVTCNVYNCTDGFVTYGSNIYIRDCTETNSSGGAFMDISGSVRAKNCKFNTSPIFTDLAMSYTSSSSYKESLDHNNVPGSIYAATRGGTAISIADPTGGSELGWVTMTLVSATYPGFYQREYSLDPGEWIFMSAKISKSVTMAYLPRLQIIDPFNDPLVTGTDVYLAQIIIPGDLTATYYPISVAYHNTSNRRMIILARLLGMNASGTINARMIRSIPQRIMW